MDEENGLSLEQIGEMLGRSESGIRSYLDRSEFNPFRFRTKKGKLRYKLPPEQLDHLKDLIFNRRGGDRIIG